MTNLNVGQDIGNGSNLRLKQWLRHGKSCKNESKWCAVFVGDILR